MLIAIVLFAAAYPVGDRPGRAAGDPARSAGRGRSPRLHTWQAQRHVVLPQVLGAVAPSLANSAIALFKDTSLVTIVSLY